LTNFHITLCTTTQQTLISLYNKVLTAVSQLPQEAGYRRHTEELTKNRLQIVESETNTEMIEKKINSGQVEELIVQAERELTLVEQMKSWQPWQPLAEEAPLNQWKWP
ncbi:NADH dehydrogenase [ubiquinone] 1 alpha subcomplex subunit 5, partial [Trichoplax sp. H2]